MGKLPKSYADLQWEIECLWTYSSGVLQTTEISDTSDIDDIPNILPNTTKTSRKMHRYFLTQFTSFLKA